jgi:LAGLIDADG endonuclease
LTDGEGSFYIKRTGGFTFSFRFQIGLHIDDLDMLLFIQKTLGFGKISTTKAQAYFDVAKLKDVGRIIEIFTNFPLNTHKHLNFLDFKKAFELYINNTAKTLELIQEIETLKKGMNTQRSNFENSESRKFRITPN